MNKKTLGLVGIALVFVLGAFFVGKYIGGQEDASGNENNGSMEVETAKISGTGDTITEDTAAHYPFVLKDSNGDFSFESDDNFNFDVSGYKILRPVSKDVNVGIAELQLYLGADENRRIRVTGLYAPDEKNTSSFPNLGMARANSVTEYLIIQGIPSSRIDRIGLRKDDLKHQKKVVHGPVEFDMGLGTSHSEANKK